MRKIRRIVPVLIALGIGLVVVAPASAGAQEITCVKPSATDIRTPSGAIDLEGYQAAVAAYNVCVGGVSEARASASTPSSALAFTGSNSTTVAVIAVAAIGLGIGAIVVARRRAT